jgi:hypothetical protein
VEYLDETRALGLMLIAGRAQVRANAYIRAIIHRFATCAWRGSRLKKISGHHLTMQGWMREFIARSGRCGTRMISG